LEDLNSLSIDELKKIRLKEEEASLKSNFFNPLDKFTEIDDLLRENIKQQHFTNQLLLALYYKKEKDGKIVPIQPNGIDTSAILEGLRGAGDDYKTLVVNIEGEKITGSETIFKISGTGILAECKFQSSNLDVNNKAYGVRIYSDKDIIYQDTWANFESRSFFETDMTCYEDVIGYYILSFKTIGYLKNLKIEVYDSKASFTNIYIKYHQKSGV